MTLQTVNKTSMNQADFDKLVQNLHPQPKLLEEVTTSDICGGDTIVHHGTLKTVCNKDILNDSFMGVSIFGDSFLHSRRKVIRAKFR